MRLLFELYSEASWRTETCAALRREWGDREVVEEKGRCLEDWYRCSDNILRVEVLGSAERAGVNSPGRRTTKSGKPWVRTEESETRRTKLPSCWVNNLRRVVTTFSMVPLTTGYSSLLCI